MADLDLPSEIEIPKDEQVLILTNRKYQSLILPYLIVMFGIFISFFLIPILITLFISLSSNINYFSNQFNANSPFLVYLEIFLIIFLILSIMVPILSYFYCKGHRYIITNKRLIIFRKFINLAIRETLLINLTDVLVQQGPIARWRNYGGISPLTPGMGLFRYYSGTQYQTQTLNFIGLKGIPNPFYIIAHLTHIQQFGKLREEY